jgi:hypothetical protein
MKMNMRRWCFGVLFAGAIAFGTTTQATIIWSNCPADPNGLSDDAVCPDEYDANTCHNTSGDLNECNCIHHGGTWDGDNEVCN